MLLFVVSDWHKRVGAQIAAQWDIKTVPLASVMASPTAGPRFVASFRGTKDRVGALLSMAEERGRVQFWNTVCVFDDDSDAECPLVLGFGVDDRQGYH